MLGIILSPKVKRKKGNSKNFEEIFFKKTAAQVPLRSANSHFLKDDYEKHSGNAVGKGLKAPTRQKISAAIQKNGKGRPKSPRD